MELLTEVGDTIGELATGVAPILLAAFGIAVAFAVFTFAKKVLSKAK